MIHKTPDKELERKAGFGTRARTILAKALLYGTILTVLAVLAGYLLLRTDAVQARIKGLAIAYVEKELNGELQVGEVTGNLLYNLSLKGVRLTGREGLVFEADRISANYLGPLLLRKIFFLNSLRMEGFVLHLRKEADGSWNLSRLMPQKKGGSSFHFILKRFSLSGGEMVLTTANGDKEEIRHIRNLNVTADIRPPVDSPPGGDLALEVRQASFTLDRPDLTLTDLTGTLFYDTDRKRLRMEDLSVKTVESEVVFHGSALLGDDSEVEVRARILSLSLPETSRILAVETPLEGAVDGSLELKGPLHHLVHRLQLHWAPLTVESEGYVDLTGKGGPAIQLSGSLRHMDPARLPWSKPSWPAGEINADISLKAFGLTSPSPSLEAHFLIKPSRLTRYEVKDGELAFSLDRDGLKVHKGRLAGPLGGLSFTGDFKGIKGEQAVKVALEAAVTDFDLTRGWPGGEVTGRVSLDLEAEMNASPLSNLKWEPNAFLAKIRARFLPSIVNGVPIEKGLLDAAWVKGKVEVRKCELSSRTGNVSLSGSILPKDRTGLMRGDVDLPDLSALPPLLAPWFPQMNQYLGLSGRLSLSAELKGDWIRPEVTGTLQGSDIRFKDLYGGMLKMEGSFRGPVQDYRSRVDLDLKDLDLEGKRFSQVKAKVRLQPDKALVELEGKHKGGEEVSLRGEVADWSLPVKEIRVDNLMLAPGKGSPLGPTLGRIENRGPIHVKVSPDFIQISPAELSSGKARLSLEGRMARAGDQELRFFVKDMPLERFSWAFTKGELLRGVLSASFDLSGTAGDPKIQSQIHVEGVSGYGLSFSKLEAALRYSGSSASIRADLYRQENRIVNVEGKAAFSLTFLPFSFVPSADGLDVAIEADAVSLSELPFPRIPHADLNGLLTVKATARGDAAHPVLKGHVTLSEGTLAFKDPARVFQVGGRADFSEDVVTINEILFKDDKKGVLRLSGSMGLERFTPSSLEIRAAGKNLSIPLKQAVMARVEPDLKLSGTLSAPVLTGSVIVNEARIDLARLQEEGPAEIRIIREGEEKEGEIRIRDEAPSLFEPLASEVTLVVPKNAWVTGQGINTELEGRIDLKKDPGKPFLFLGQLKTIRGTYEFQGKTFKLTEGTVQFMGLPDPDPKLDIRAETKIKEVGIIIAIAGTAKQMKLSLSSDPQMDQTDIISYLVFGKPASSLNARQAFNAEGAALSLGGQIAASQMKKVLGNVLSLDMISIDPGGENVREGSISVGKYVTDDVFITYDQGFSADKPSQLGVTYEINSNFSVETQLVEQNSSGIDLFWQFDF